MPEQPRWPRANPRPNRAVAGEEDTASSKMPECISSASHRSSEVWRHPPAGCRPRPPTRRHEGRRLRARLCRHRLRRVPRCERSRRLGSRSGRNEGRGHFGRPQSGRRARSAIPGCQIGRVRHAPRTVRPATPWRTPTSRSSASARRPPPAARPISPTSTACVEDLIQPLSESPPAQAFHTIVIRSTVPPGTVEDVTAVLRDAFADSGPDVAVAVCPEFLREGTGIADFLSPPYTVIGASDLRAIDTVSRLFAFLDAPLRVVHPRTAEALKYACNAFHATKVSFANELGRIFSRLGVDSREVMETLLRGHRSQHLTQVLAARIRLRRIVPTEGPSLTSLPGADREHRHPAALRCPGEQPVVDRRSHRPRRRRRGPPGRPARFEFQAG